jgi:acetoacetyl-CoA synthetase
MKGWFSMNSPTDSSLLWAPSAAIKDRTNLNHYMQWLEKERGLAFQSYNELWRWSVTDLEDFWETIWDYFQVEASKGYTCVLAERKMPGAEWFVGAELNYAQHVFRNMTDERPAMLHRVEDGPLHEVAWQELYDKTAAMDHYLRGLGVEQGDRVVAYLPHIPETIISFLACASLGAVWSSCSPDFGSPSVLDRFRQIEPKVLIAVDGYRWNGKTYDRCQAVAELQAALPTLEKTILITRLGDSSQASGLENTVLWEEALDASASATTLEFEQVPFSHPLWILYSSGTTGVP